MSTTPAGHPCELCDVVKPSAYALNDHMANVHPEQFEEWRNRQRPRPRPSIVADLLGYVAANLPDEQPQRAAVEEHPADGEQPRPHPARALAALAEQHIAAYRAEHGVNRSTRAILTGMSSIHRLLTAEADRLDADRPADERVALLDGRDALAFVIIRPANDGTDRVTVEAGSHGMSKAAAAYVLRATAADFDEAALAEGDEPIPYTLTGQAETLDEQADEEQPSRAHVVDYTAQINTPECVEDCPGCEAQQ